MVANSDVDELNKNQKLEDLDLTTHLTQRSNRVFFVAQTKASELKNEFVDTEHILHGLTADPEIYKFLLEIKIPPQSIEEELEKIYKKESFSGKIQFSPRVKRILDKSLVIARKLGYEFISPEHILLSLYEEGEGVGSNILNRLGLKKEELNKKIVGKKEGFGSEDTNKKSILETYTNDLTQKAAQGLLDPVVERSDIIERLIHNLSRRTKNNPVLVGEAGVGKTAIVEGLAQKIVKKEVPESLLKKKVLQLDLMSVLAGTSHRGEFEERMKQLIQEIKDTKGEVILFIDEIHNLVGAGGNGEGSMDASNFLKPSLARGEMQIIGTTTLTEYRKYIEKDPALERRFQPIVVPEPTEEQAIKMLKAIRDKYESYHRVKIPDEAIEVAVKLAKRYIGDRFLPDKAIDLIDESAAAVRLPLISLPDEIRSLDERLKGFTQELQDAKNNSNTVKSGILQPKIEALEKDLKDKNEEYTVKKGQTTSSVSPEIIRDIIARWTGIPVSRISDSETEKLSKLEDIMHTRLVGQENAVSAVASAVRRGRAGLKQNHKPIGGFIFLGPTGVGKTELAKTLAEILFGSEDLMIRLDMTEYMEKHEVSKLLGAPPGYVGYEEGGKLTEAVRRKPYSVVLFDEVEKAHPDIFNILLQILDDGRLTDNKGRTISFKNTVVICTSNIASNLIQDEILKKHEDTAQSTEIKEKVMNEIRKFFKPELINRFDEVIIFEPLKEVHMFKIAGLQLKALRKLLEDQGIGFSWTDNVIKEIVNVGFDPIFGARPLKRTITNLIENPISTLIIEKKVKETDQLNIDFENDNFVFNVEKICLPAKLHCNKCGLDYISQLIKNSTVICTKCLSTDVKIV
jgi:ATP-dependent Clp protease ATP-binding subunit ClpC